MDLDEIDSSDAKVSEIWKQVIRKQVQPCGECYECCSEEFDPNHVDAQEVGGKSSCTLILTEFMPECWPIALPDKYIDYYGIFSLRGPLLNVKEATAKKIKKNAEINRIIQILGLEHGKIYDNDNVKTLKYRHLMILTNQDHDGYYIKGLLINLFHYCWPSLLKIPDFLGEFLVPIVELTLEDESVLSFYNMAHYKSWKEKNSEKDLSIKYYKGMQYSTWEEEEYFLCLERHKKYFTWVDEKDGDAIDMAFSKNNIEARKTWLQQYKLGTYLDHHQENLIKYSDFVNKELILFFLADLQQSIPSMFDGLTLGQRRVLFCAFQRNLVFESGSNYVSRHFGYCDGEHATSITQMSQGFVGSININLFSATEPFECNTRSNLSPIARFLFPKDDDLILDYFPRDDDILLDLSFSNEQLIEPLWYAPVIPLILVNGTNGHKVSESGCSTFVPSYNPREICANVRRLLLSEPMVPMVPMAPKVLSWYTGSLGNIKIKTSNESDTRYVSSGYNKLNTKISTNMFLFDSKGALKKYDNPEQILQEFFEFRLSLYKKRKERMMDDLDSEIEKLSKSISSFECGHFDDPDAFSALMVEFEKKGGTIVIRKKSIDDAVVGDCDSPKYELSMDFQTAFGTYYAGKLNELNSQKHNLISQLCYLSNSTPNTLWLNDLAALDRKLKEEFIADSQRDNLICQRGLDQKLKQQKPTVDKDETDNDENDEMPTVENDQKPTVVDNDENDEMPTVVENDENDEMACDLASSLDRQAAIKEAGKVPSRKTAASKRAAAKEYHLATTSTGGKVEVVAAQDERAVKAADARKTTKKRLANRRKKFGGSSVVQQLEVEAAQQERAVKAAVARKTTKEVVRRKKFGGSSVVH